MRLFLAGVLTANNSQQMPISYLSNTSHLLKGLCQGKLSQIFLYQILHGTTAEICQIKKDKHTKIKLMRYIESYPTKWLNEN
ncbi:hypothetical protein ACTXT7_009810 [Hymenolepis weldensis]